MIRYLILPYLAIAIISGLMAWAFLHGLDRELDIREAQTRARIERIR